MSLQEKIETLIARNASIADEIEALAATPDTDADAYATAQNTVTELNSEFDENEKQIDTLSAANQRVIAGRNAAAAIQSPGQLIGNDGAALGQPGQAVELAPWDKIVIPAVARGQKSKHFDTDKDAFFSGLFLMAACGSRQAQSKLDAIGFDIRTAKAAQEGGTGNLGGYAVPQPLAATIIRLVEEYGVLRQWARNIPMSSATLDVPKRANGLTIVYPGEGGAITPSDVTFAQVNLIARKSAYLNVMSTEVSEDAIISMADLISTEMAWGFAADEDRLGFVGDGTAGDNNITGVESALAAGAQVTVGANWGAVGWGDFHAMTGKIAYYAGLQPAWFINHQGYAEAMQRLAYAAGGNTTENAAAGMPRSFMGYPVVVTQALPRELSVGKLGVVFGDLRLGMVHGTRRDITIRTLVELYAANDQIGIVGTKRHDTVTHDVGDATNAGCIVGGFGA